MADETTTPETPANQTFYHVIHFGLSDERTVLCCGAGCEFCQKEIEND